jgi:fibronectin-binding autotransporter adhesin
MKTIPGYIRTIAILAAGVLVAQMASAQTQLWTGGGGGGNQNWSSTANWTGSVVPSSGTNVIFTNTAGSAASAGPVDNFVDGGFASPIAQLQFINTNTSGTSGFFHTTQIGAGQTLTVQSNLIVGLFTSTDLGGNNQIYAGFTGQGTLAMNNPSAYLGVSQGSATSGSQGATLNLTNLNNFNATLGGIYVGVYNTPNVTLARQRGILYLAKTNVINCIGNAPHAYGNEGQIEVGENLGNGANTAIPMYLGIMNTIAVNTITIGGDKQGSGALLAFNPVFTNASLAPTAVFYGTNGSSSRVGTWRVGDNSNQSTTGTSTSGTADFSNGSLNALVNTLIIGEGDGASGGGDTSVGSFTFSAGTNNVNTVYIGYRNNAGTGTSHPTGTMNVNGTATLIANNAICLSFNGGGTGGYALGTLNINGGTVLANTITNGVEGGANATANISMTGGLLGITGQFGSIGAYTAPVKSLSLSGSVLQLAVNPFQTNVEVSSLTLSGTSNYISISAIPASIITYPTQIPLIAYGGSIGSTFNIQLTNGLPGTYQGYISNNTQNASIDIVLTTGPNTTPALTWNGLANNSWDITSLDWSNATTLVPYSDGSIVTFDDTAKGPTGINIASGVAPTSMTFNNNLLPYAFSGGGVMGYGGLTMNGSSSILFTNSGNTFAGGMNINSGTVQFGNGGTSGTIPQTGNVLDNGSLIIDRSGNVTMPNTISGSGIITESGTSVLSLTASNSFSGTVNVTSGTLLVNGVLSGSVNSSLGSTIGGAGTNSGLVTVGGLVQPSASTGTPSAFTSGALSLSSGATAAFDLTANNTTTGGGINDLLTVNGNLTLNNNTISLNFVGVPVSGQTYTLVNFSGTKSGSFNSTVGGTHFGATLNQSASPVQVTLSGAGASLKWNSTVSMTNNLWNVGSPSNWLNMGTSLRDVFYQGDTVVFDDSVAGNTNNISIPGGAVVSPIVLSNNSSTVNYTITGPGQIGGAVSIIKQGSSTLNLSSANVNFTGTATVSGGILQAGNGNAFGSAGTVVATNGGTLDLDNQGIGNVPVIISGSGVGGNGALINSVYSANGDIHALDTVELAGNATIGGPGRWDIRVNGGQNGALTTTAGGSISNPYNLTKTGTNFIGLVSCAIDASIGNIDIQSGQLGMQLATAQLSSGWFGLGTANRTISVENGAMLEFNTLNTAYPLFQNLNLNNGSTLLSDAGQNAVSGTVTLQGNDTISVTGGTAPCLQFTGPIVGSGNLIVNGTLPLVLSSVCTYTGNTLINAGILQLGFAQSFDGSITGSSNIIVAANAVLDASQRSDSTLTLAAGQTLLGNGTIYGNLTVGPGGTVLAGTNFTAIGLLSVSNNVALQGDTYVKLNAATKTNDVIITTNTSGAISYGGTLTLTNISATPFAAGESFQIFSATNYSGAFTSIVPVTPGAGLAWNTNTLSSGILSVVVGTAPAQPGITSITLSGTQLVISGTNGTAGQQYNVLESTNLLTPVANWTPISTNTFSGSAFSVTNTVNPHAPQNFYLLRLP